MVACLSNQALVAFVEGRLSHEGLDELHRHMDSCLSCRQLVLAMAGSHFLEDDSSPPSGAATAGCDPPAALQTGTAPWTPPQQVDEFRILRLLGRGAMGQVFLARDMLLERIVAIKFIADPEPDIAMRERLLSEARAIARLQHPNVVAIFTVGELAGRSYLVSEYVRGRSLAIVEKPLARELVVSIAKDLARGLAAAHRRGVLHRDLKPANAILTEDGQAKLLDFGLAKLIGPRPGSSPELSSRSSSGLSAPPPLSLTLSGAIVGTPLYLAPEIWGGEPASKASDIYSLGVLLHELCVGRPPRSGTTLKELRELALHDEGVVVRNTAPDVDPALASVIDCCLRRRPEERYESADALYEALAQLTRTEPVRAAPEGSPYRGLRVFEERHRALFFGRSTEIDALADRLRSEPLVVVAGDSGVGKSSLCRAGVLPLVREGALGERHRWNVAIVAPGRAPLLALADALCSQLGGSTEELLALLHNRPLDLGRHLRQRGNDRGLLVYIDQMEELVTQIPATEAQLFSAAIGALSSRLEGMRVLGSVRGDFLTRIAGLPGFGEDLVRALYLLRPLPPAGLREAITGPAQLKGVSFESDSMVEELRDATADGGLPLLQFALSELWEVRDATRRIIPIDALRAIGGVSGALSRHADAVVQALLPAEREAARRLLVRLVSTEDTRLRRSEQELLADSTVDLRTLEALVRGRLVVARKDESGATQYEVAHEALITGWPTLRQWLSSDVGRRLVQQRIEAATREWQRTGRSRDALWGERRLAEVTAAALSVNELSGAEAEFVSASRRRLQRQRGFRIALFSSLLLAIGILSLLGTAWYHATEHQRRAEELAQSEAGLRARTLSQQPGHEDEALQAAIRSVAAPMQRQRRPLASAALGLVAAVRAARHSLPLRGHQKAVRKVMFTPDSLCVVSHGEDLVTRLWDAKTGAPLATFPNPDGDQYSFTLSSDGSKLLVPGKVTRLWDLSARSLSWSVMGDAPYSHASFSSDDARAVLAAGGGSLVSPIVRIVDARSGRTIVDLVGHTRPVGRAVFSPDGEWIATASEDRTVRLWDARTGRLLRVLTGHGAAVLSVSFLAGRQRILSSSEDGTARIWDAESGAALHRLEGHEGSIASAVLSSDGKTLLTASTDRTAALWDAETGTLQRSLRGHQEGLSAAAFSADGERILTVSNDGTARLFSALSGEPLAVLAGHAAGLTSAAFSPDGQRLATASLDGTVRLWNGQLGRWTSILRGHTDGVFSGQFSEDGNTLLTSSQDRTARIWDGHSGQLRSTLAGHRDGVRQAELSPDGHRAVTAGWDGTARLWDVRTARLIAVLEGHRETVYPARFSPDGQRILTASWDGTARLWEGSSGKLLVLIKMGAPASVITARFSPDGRRFFVLTSAKELRFWDTQTGAILPVRLQIGDCNYAQFSPDGRLIATGHDDGITRLWDALTGAQLAALPGSWGEVWRVFFSPDGARLTSGAREGAQIWDLHSLRLVAELKGHTGRVLGARFSPDGERIVTASYDRTARLWDARSGRLIKALLGHQQEIQDALFSPDGSRIATISYDRTVRLWDGYTGEPYSPSLGNDLLYTRTPQEIYGATIQEARDTEAVPVERLSEQLHLACLLLRHQPGFRQVEDVCAAYLAEPAR